MRILLACTWILMSSCGRDPGIPHKINPDFDKYLLMFREDAQKESVDTSQLNKITVIDYDDSLDVGDVIAKCYFKHSQERKYGITFYENYWHEIHVSRKFNYFSDIKRYKIILHEIGHCAYHLEHNNVDVDAIMYPDVNEPSDNFETEKKLFFMDVLKNRNEWESETPL